MELHAEWIWTAGEPAPRNTTIDFRGAFWLERVPAAAELHITADARYVLFVNGARTGNGPARCYHGMYEFDTYEIAPLLRVGKNVIAVRVMHWGEGTLQHAVGRGGLLVRLDGDASGPLLVSDTSWRTAPAEAFRRAAPRIACQLGWEEQYDARQEHAGWTDPEFDDLGWEPATVLGVSGMEPWGQLRPRTIPFLTDEPMAPVRTAHLGTVRRPDITATVTVGPYVSPHDHSANRRSVDVMLATVLHLPNDGDVAFRQSALYGEAPALFLDGVHIPWTHDIYEGTAVRTLTAGEHFLILDWQGETHDLDVTLSMSGIPGMSVSSPLGWEGETWAIAPAPGLARIEISRAITWAQAGASNVTWQRVTCCHATDCDVAMGMVASVPLVRVDESVLLPLLVPAGHAGVARHYLFDYGEEVSGWVEIDIEAPAGTHLDFLGFEGMRNGQPVFMQRMRNTLRYTSTGGQQSYRSLVRRGFRYLLVAIHGNRFPVTVHRVTARLAVYPGKHRGSFRCSDDHLNGIWELCARTLRCCSEDTFVDAPYEQTLWAGDAYVGTLVHATVHGDPRLTARSLQLIGQSLGSLGMVNSQVPGDWTDLPIPNWSWLWSLACWEHYRLTADAGLVRELYHALATQAAFIDRSRNHTGLFVMPGAWHFIDWADVDAPSDAAVAHENFLAVAALRATAQLAGVTEHPDEERHWNDVADQLAAEAHRQFWSEERSAYVDCVSASGDKSGRVSMPTNVCALFAKVPPPESTSALFPLLASPPDSWIGVGTPFVLFLYLTVLAREGHVEDMVRMVRDTWGAMLESGSTTAWETLPGHEPDGSGTRSWCHLWSTGPAHLLATWVLGIRPIEPGYRRVVIEPKLGNLQWASGATPTPHGPIVVQVDRREQGQLITVVLPAGITAELHVIGSSVAVPSVSHAESITRSGAGWVIELPTGASATIKT